MPSVSVILKNGAAIQVEGANDAKWVFEKMAPGATQNSLMLIVSIIEPNKTETRGKFRAEEVVGYTVDVR